MVAKNDITGDSIRTKGVSDKYRDNYDAIFGKKEKKLSPGKPVAQVPRVSGSKRRGE